MIWLAIDPGLTTGWATYNDRTEEFASGEVRGRHEFFRWLHDEQGFRDTFGRTPNHVIIERWDVRKDTFGKSAQEDARYIIGAVEYLCWRIDLPYHEQRPGEAKKFSTNDKLRSLCWYTGGYGHGDDAARHLLVALAKARTPAILEALT